jgi:hypothetical protein
MHTARQTLGVARKVRRRTLAAAVVRRGGAGLAVGCGVGLVGVLAAKLGWLGAAPWEVVLGGAAAIGLAAGVAAGLSGDWSLLAAARRADRVLGLRDRLGNGLSFSRGQPGPAEQLAIRDAERVAGRVSTARVAPVRFGAAWAAWPVVLAGAIACGVWVPVAGPRVRGVAQHRAGEPERRAAAGVLAEAARDAREAAGESLLERAGEGELARMEEIERELLDGSREPGEALADGARQLTDLADRVERAGEAGALADQRAREQLADQVEAGEGASELARALSEGDLERAREAASAMSDRFGSMTPAERERYAEELESLADQVRGAREDRELTGGEDAAASDPLDAALREQGIEEPRSLGGSEDPAEVRERLEERGVEPEAAEQLAERVAARNREAQAREQADEELDRLSEAAREAAEQLREPTPPDQPGAETQDHEPPEPGQQPKAESEPQTEESPSPEGAEDRAGEEPKPGAEPRGPEPGEAQPPADQADGKPGQKPGETAAKQGDEKPGEMPAEQGDEEPGEKPAEQGGEKPGEQGGKQPGQKPGAPQGEQPGNAPESQGEPKSGEGQPDGPTQTDEPGETPTGKSPNGKTPSDRPEGAGEQTDTKPGAAPGDGAQDAPAADTEQPTPDAPGPGAAGQQPDGQQPAPEGREPGDAGPAPSEGEGGAEEGPTRMTDGQGDAPDRDAMERFRRQIDRMAQRGQDAQQQRRDAESLREQAERLLERASPEERRELERLAREAMGGDEDSGLGGEDARPDSAGARLGTDRAWDSETFDARGGPDGPTPRDGQVIAEWYGEEQPGPSTAGAAGGGGLELREAARGAERAIERRAVPRERRELVRRVFERFRQRAAETDGPAADGGGAGAGDGR